LLSFPTASFLYLVVAVSVVLARLSLSPKSAIGELAGQKKPDCHGGTHPPRNDNKKSKFPFIYKVVGKNSPFSKGSTCEAGEGFKEAEK
jgi:hypothetical protein